MKYTNRHNLPEPLVNAVKRQNYRKAGHISVTGLIKPPQMDYLEQKHWNEIEVDVSEEIWLLLGSSVHYVLEQAKTDNALQEELLKIKVDGWVISGRPDLLHNRVLTDFKVTSVFSFLLGDKPEWEAQLNVYAALYHAYGFRVEELQIVGVLKDWNQRRSMQEEDYPSAPALARKIPLWPEEKTRDYIKERVAIHQAARQGDYPDCTSQEKWQKEDAWAVKKKSKNGKVAKTALRVFKSEVEAELFAYDYEQNHPGKIAVVNAETGRTLRLLDTVEQAEEYKLKAEFGKSKTPVKLEPRPGVRAVIERRPGEAIRCERFCKVNRWCQQYRRESGVVDLEVA